MDDWQLLQDYVERESETAFRTLANRYVNLVYSVALRQVCDAQLAEEVAQAVFILLARKACGFRQGVVITAWLFRTTRFVASRAVRAEQRRQRREEEALAMQQLTAPDDTWKRISPIIDEALESLGERDRNALLLRFFNDKSHRETAVALGVSEDAAKKRVTRALGKLRSYFAGRGVTLSATLLASAVVANAARAATPEVVGSISSKLIASGSAGASILPLVRETLNAWRWARLKLAGTLGATAAVVAIVGIALLPHRPFMSSKATGNENSRPLLTNTHSVASAFPARQSVRAANPGEQVLHLKLLARDTGEPVANARLAISTVANGEWQRRFDLLTDETGSADASYPASATRLDIGVLSWGWAAKFATWRTDQDPAIPADYTLRVDRVTQPMSGWLRDEQGQPVANAEVEMQFSHNDMAQREPPRERLGFIRPAVVAKSDKNGWWTCAVIDPKENYIPELIARRPDFAPAAIAKRVVADDMNKGSMGPMPLWSGKTVTTMVRGLNLTGKVFDDAGQPVARAKVVHDPVPMFLGARRAETETADDGSFAFGELATGEFDFIVTAPGFAQEYRKVSITNGTQEVEVRLKPGGLLRLRVVDEQGEAVPNAVASLTGAFGGYAPEGDWSAESGPDGRIEWNSAPRGQALYICASKPGWVMTRGIMVKADGQEQVIRLKPGLLVTGRVLDADTGQPILGAKSFPGYGLQDHCWYRGDTWRSTNDTFQVRFTEGEFPWRVRVEAEGYVAFASDPLPPDFNGSLDVALHRPDLSKAVRGVVLRPDGQPPIRAEVALLTSGHGAYLGRARFAHREADDKLITNADGEGRFQFEKDPDSDKAHTAIAVSESGFARVLLQQLTESLTIRLEPWGRVEGTVDASARRRPVDSLFMQVQGPPVNPGTLQLSPDSYRKPFEGDDFAFEFVPPGDFYVCLSAGAGVPYPEHHRTWLTVTTGEAVKILVAERGHRLKGRLVATEGEGDWAKQDNVPTHEELMPGMRLHSRQYVAGKFARLIPLVRELSPEENASYNYPTAWETSFTPLQHNCSPGVRMDAILSLALDGNFESLEGVLPGDYNLQVSINGRNFEQQTITVPEGTPSAIDLGNIMVNTNTPVTGRIVRSSDTAKTKSQQ